MLKLSMCLEEDGFLDLDDMPSNDPTEELIETVEDTEEISEAINDNLKVIRNIAFLRNHVQRFGITKEFLHLVNSNGELSQAFNIMLPSCEEENIDQINEDELPEADVFVEAMAEAIDKVKERIQTFFKYIKDKFKQFVAFIKRVFSFKSKKVKDANEKMKNRSSAKPSDKDGGEYKLFPYENFKVKVYFMKDALDQLKTLKIDKTTGRVDHAQFDKIDKFLNSDISSDNGKLIYKNSKFDIGNIKNTTLKASGYTYENLKELGGKIQTVFETGQRDIDDFTRSLYRSMDEAERSFLGNSADVSAEFVLFKHNWDTLFAISNNLSKATGVVADFMIYLVSKLQKDNPALFEEKPE